MRFKNIGIGNVYKLNEDTYIKISSSGYCARLDNLGSVVTCDDDTNITLLQAIRPCYYEVGGNLCCQQVCGARHYVTRRPFVPFDMLDVGTWYMVKDELRVKQEGDKYAAGLAVWPVEPKTVSLSSIKDGAFEYEGRRYYRSMSNVYTLDAERRAMPMPLYRMVTPIWFVPFDYVDADTGDEYNISRTFDDVNIGEGFTFEGATFIKVTETDAAVIGTTHSFDPKEIVQ